MKDLNETFDGVPNPLSGMFLKINLIRVISLIPEQRVFVRDLAQEYREWDREELAEAIRWALEYEILRMPNQDEPQDLLTLTTKGHYIVSVFDSLFGNDQ